MEWINVRERMPEVRKDVLCLFYDEKRNRKRIEISWIDSIGIFLYEDIYGEVTHWMPLPKPPEE